MKPCVPIQISIYSITSHKNLLIRGLTLRLLKKEVTENTIIYIFLTNVMFFFFNRETWYSET